MTTRSLEVRIELGHKAVLKGTPTAEGYTHDWTVFVRGPEGCRIENFVDKVVFILHESFPKSKRTLREPPYQVSESGYAGFNMPIIVFFKTKEEPKKLDFVYDLYLSLDGKPINNIRCEKLTFHNPPDDFCQKLLKGGAGIKGGATATTGAVAAVSPGKKPPTPPQKKSPHPAGAPPVSTPFSDLFGAPIIKGQDVKDSKKEKRKDKRDKEHKRDKKDKSASSKDEKSKDAVKTEKTEKPEKAEKPEKITLTLSANGKINPGHSSDVKKETVREKKRDNSSSPNQKEKDDLKRKKKKSSSHKDSPDSKKPRLEDTNSTATATVTATAASVAAAPAVKAKKKSQSKPPESVSTTSPPFGNVVAEANDVEFTPSPPDQHRKSKTVKEVKNANTSNDDLKPSLPPPKSQAPRRVASPADASKKKRPVSNSSALNAMIMEMDADGSSPESETEASRYKRLYALKAKITKLPKEKMQLVVDIVEESGNFELTDESFDFDLHVADALTITRLQQLVS